MTSRYRRASKRCVFALLSVALLATIVVSQASAETNWPRLRGPSGTGISEEKGLPVEWTPDAVAWRTEIRGRGQSSPVIWGERIFLTSADQNPDKMVERRVVCLDRSSGKILWEQLSATGPGEPLHTWNDWASPSCVTDGERVIAFFGRGGIHCYDFEGKKLWSRDLGEFVGPWGVAASPVIVGNLVIQNCDADKDAYLIGLDKTTGEEVWKTKRIDIRGWSTPVLINSGTRDELVINGHHGVRAYDPATGTELWYCKSFNGRGSPMPAYGHGLLFLVNGLAGDVYAVKPGGSGDVTATHMAWHTPRNKGRDLPSPLMAGDYLYVISTTGVATLYDPDKGTEIWSGRQSGNYSGAPIFAGGLIYVLNEAGEVVVIKPGQVPEEVARNRLNGQDDEIFRASLVPSQGQLFARSNQALYCIGKRTAQ